MDATYEIPWLYPDFSLINHALTKYKYEKSHTSTVVASSLSIFSTQ